MQENLLRHRPAAFVALSMIIGSVAADRGWISEQGSLILLVASLLLLIVALRWRPVLFAASVIGITAVSGLSLLQSRSCETSRFARIADMRPQNVVVTGILSEVDPLEHGYRWVMDIDSIALQPTDNSARHAVPIAARLLVWASVDHEALRLVNKPMWDLPRSGDRLRIFTSLSAIHDATNPYEYDRDRKLQRLLAVDASAEIHSVFDYTIIKRHTSSFDLIESYLASIRSFIDARLDEAVREPQARSFVKAVVVGEREDMDHETYEDFTKAGIAHILAVSGFNVAIVAGVFAQLLRLLGIWRLRLRTVLLMLAVLLYAATVGFQPSVVRALLMIEIYYVALLLERKRDPVNIVAFAAIINLLLRPNDLFDVGFQLSYICVLGLAVITPELKRLLVPDRLVARVRWLEKPIDVALLSIAAALASAPIIIVQFHRVSLAGLLTNLPAIPISSAITALGFLLVPITAISHGLGVIYGDATTLLTKLLLFSTTKAASIPVASRPIAQPEWYWIAALILAAIYLLRSSDTNRLLARSSIVGVLLGIVTLTGAKLTRHVVDSGKLSVLFSDVGQGDCIFLKTPHGRNYIIDCGTISRHNVARAEEALLPLLRAESNTTIDGIFLSHMHRDHYGGAPMLVANCDVASIYTSGERVNDPIARQLDSLALRRQTRVALLQRGQRIELDSGVILYVLHPGREDAVKLRTAYGSHANSGSLAFKICYGSTSFLFLGDIERSEEELMKDEYGDFLHSSVVKVAHHGSLTSSSRLFGAEVRPQFAVISVGDNNRFGHPAEAIVRRWYGLGATVARTDRDGAVLFESNGSDVQRLDWRER